MEIKVKAFAKINLMLDIVSTRTDGYHDLFMIMQSIGIYDTITVTQTKSRKITITCNINDIPLDEHNIAYKAADAFFKAVKTKNKGINIDIIKRIPHAAGLAGGSADGAGVLVALNQLCGTGLTDDELCDIGVKIGADVPFCIKGGTLLAQGIGDVLNKVKPLRKCYILIAKPNCSVNTANAYKQFDECGKVHTPDKFGMLCAMQGRDLADISSRMENVFEQFIAVDNKVEIKNIMRKNGSLGVCMSGSGPTVFGIFDDKEKAVNASLQLKKLAKDIAVTTPVSKGCKIVGE
ncbi:MAG: 4-(cytidine 5'-diphospho)-2-C-methyl-D-erythritol kinase [Acetobacter sp.]|nr:4-(cytidine 5'-diphospho)-2-C-methyl-D-erythritol kinase [Bacteroides sp.]MCM1341461.1 4-(cytidine 5'-diphospho)-2-C-methyl-D-erythritol kinase [Acetobacter sp.]MCM1433413.1 4-(cytidine 5'-diphospho)-2-C-methyl-D-erythritol kinase [Clostridiales bacterium]